jgi:hypothetical protein
VHRPALGIPTSGHQAGQLKHLNVLGHRLFRDVERLGQLVDRRRSAGQLRHDGAPNRVRQGQKGPVQTALDIAAIAQSQSIR